MRVLLIDDDEDLRNLLSRYIRAQWADAQIEAYDPLQRDLPGADFPLGSYDVLVLDYMLGRGDGLEWLKTLKQRTDCPKVLFLTGAGNEIIAVREEAFNRARSDSSVMRRTGLAQWLATAYLETRDADGDSIRERHKAIEKTIRGLQKRAEPPVRAKAAAT